MGIKKIVYSLLMLTLVAVLGSCSGAEESAIAKKITLKTNSSVTVLPNTLYNELGQTCFDSISGPRVRMRLSIKWEGKGNLMPLVVRLVLADSRLSGEYAGSVSPGNSSAESLAYLFDGVSTDYIPEGTDTTYSTASCFLDYGGLPKTVTELKGNSQVEVPATLSIMGVVRDENGDDKPFIKEISTAVTYVAGSVPVTQ